MDNVILLSMPGGQEWFLIFLIVLLLFGAKRIPEVAQNLGKGIREFKKSMNEVQQEIESSVETKDAAKPKIEPQITPPKQDDSPKPTNKFE
jgi:sec-independent protein translocase protein TatA